MKSALITLIAIALLFAGCKKDSANKNKTYQLNSVTYTESGINTNVIYIYNSQGQLTADYDPRMRVRVKYTYGADGYVNSAELSDAETSFILETDQLIYSGNTVSIQATGGDVRLGNFTYTFNDKKQLIKADSYDNTYITYNYNDAGDVTSLAVYSKANGAVTYSASYTYDNKPNPFHTMVAKNFHFGIFGNTPALVSAHNMVTSSQSIATNKYQYLDNGLPYSITSLSSDGGASTYVTYNYAVK